MTQSEHLTQNPDLLLEQLELLTGYRNADPKDLETIYRYYLHSVTQLVQCGFCYSRTKLMLVPGIQELSTQYDLIQETFLKAFSETARKNYDGKQPFRLYLLRITKNLMIDRLRKKNREVSDDLLDNFQVTEPNPAESAHWQRQKQATLKWSESLAEDLKQFYKLRYQEELPQTDVAKQLNLTRRKVRTLENRLRQLLKKYLKNNKLWP